MAAVVLNDRSDNDRKIFCGGLSKDVSDEDLKNYFSTYGAVQSVNLKIDNYTKQSRGFGFVVFEDPEGLASALQTERHELKGKKFETKQAEGPEPLLKVFAGGLKPETTDDDIRNHFQVYGNITHVNVAVDKMTGKSRGFAFITYETEAMADAASAEGKHEILGKTVDVKKAKPQTDSGSRGGRGGRGGGGRGGRGGGGYNNGYGYGSPQGYNGYNDGYYNGYSSYDSYNSYDSYSNGYSQPSYGGYNNGYSGSYAADSYGQGAYDYSRPAAGGYPAAPPAGSRGRYQPY